MIRLAFPRPSKGAEGFGSKIGPCGTACAGKKARFGSLCQKNPRSYFCDAGKRGTKVGDLGA